MSLSIAHAIEGRRTTIGMTSFGRRVKVRREELGMKQPELAKASGIRQPTISNIETGRNQGSKYVARLAAILKVRPIWLTDGTGPKEVGSSTKDSEPRLIFINRYQGARIGVGKGVDSVEDGPVDQVAFRDDWLRSKGWHPKSLVAAPADGRSMEPRIQHGDLLLIDTADKIIKDGNIYALKEFGARRAKRLFTLSDGSLRISSDNPLPEFKDEVVRPDRLEHIEIIGRVVWAGGSV